MLKTLKVGLFLVLCLDFLRLRVESVYETLSSLPGLHPLLSLFIGLCVLCLLAFSDFLLDFVLYLLQLLLGLLVLVGQDE